MFFGQVPTIPMAQIDAMRLPKGEHFAFLKEGDITFDASLPKPWLDNLADWCKSHAPEVTYDLIRSSTVWAYTYEFRFSGTPLTVCTEVEDAIRRYVLSINGGNYEWKNEVPL